MSACLVLLTTSFFRCVLLVVFWEHDSILAWQMFNVVDPALIVFAVGVPAWLLPRDSPVILSTEY